MLALGLRQGCAPMPGASQSWGAQGLGQGWAWHPWDWRLSTQCGHCDTLCKPAQGKEECLRVLSSTHQGVHVLGG